MKEWYYTATLVLIVILSLPMVLLMMLVSPVCSSVAERENSL